MDVWKSMLSAGAQNFWNNVAEIDDLQNLQKN